MSQAHHLEADRDLKVLKGGKKPDSNEVSERTRSDIAELAEKPQLSFEAAMQRLATISNKKSLKKFARACDDAGLLKVIFTEHSFEVSPNDSDESRQLTEALISKRDEVIAGTKNETQADTEPKESEPKLEELLEVISKIDELKTLNELALDLHRAKLINRIPDGRKWNVEAIEGKTDSQKITQAINARKKILVKEIGIAKVLEKREQEKIERRIAGLVKVIEEKDSVEELEKFVWQMLVQRLNLMHKKNSANKDWTVEPLENVKGSQELVDKVLSRKTELQTTLQRSTMSKLLEKYSTGK